MRKTIITWLLVLTMLVSVLPLGAAAYENGSWSEAYRRFLMEDGWKNDRNLTSENQLFALLYDFDRDDVPELVVFNTDSVHTAISMKTLVYAWADGQMKNIGACDGNYLVEYFRYAPDSAYPGLFFDREDRGYHTANYYSVKNGSLIREAAWYTDSFGNRGGSSDAALADLGRRSLSGSDAAFGTLWLVAVKDLDKVGWDAFVRMSAASQRFLDVPVTAYYTEAVAWAMEKNITAGTAEHRFSPDDQCTRAQVVTFLWRAAGMPEPNSAVNPFRDVKSSDYFYKAVLWAVEQKITQGTDTDAFSPDAPCTRGQVVTFLWRVEGMRAGSASVPFSDVPQDQYYAEAVRWAVSEKITQGTSDTTFSPDLVCTRAQIVTLLQRDLEK